MGGSGMQWSFSNTNNSPILSFKSAQQRGLDKVLSPALLQRNCMEKQGGSNFPFPTPHWQNNEGSSIINAPNGPIVGSTDLRDSSNISNGPCQLTIFYNGSVCVYDNVPPKKAQAIMLLAGNGDSKNSNNAAFAPTPPKVHQPTAVKQQQQRQQQLLNKLAPISNRVSLPSHVISSLPPIITPTCVSQVKVIKPVPAPTHIIKSPDIHKSSPIVEVPRRSSIPSAVPQARKASLARFLEKRKERVVSTSPYTMNKNTFECIDVGQGRSTFATHSARSSPRHTIN